MPIKLARLTLIILVGYTFGFASSPGYAQTGFLTDLGAVAPVMGINNAGQVVLQNYLYSGGTLTPLPSNMSGAGISGNGQVVGTIALGSGAGFACSLPNGEGGPCAIAVYSNGVLTQYPVFHSEFDESVGNWGAGINGGGTIVGWYSWVHFQGGAIMISNGTFSDVGYPTTGCPSGIGQIDGQALAINDAGQITGTCAQSAFLLSQGTYINLGPGQGNAINSNGTVAGWTYVGALLPDNQYPPSEGAVFNNGGITLLPGTEQGFGINDTGFVVGDASYGAFFYNGVVINLNDWVLEGDSLKPYVTLLDARGINNSGLVVVNGADSRTQAHHAYLMQVPLIRVRPGPLIFPTGSAASQTVTFTNAGSSGTTLGSVSISGSFSILTNNCSSSLPAGAACEIAVAPMAGGTASGNLTLLAAGVPIAVPLTVSAPLTVSLTANATTMAPGFGLSLTWTSAVGASCTATGGSTENGWMGLQPASGTQELAGLTVGIYHFGLTCTLGAQTKSAEVTVLVAVPGLKVTLSASPTTMKSGGSTTLTWSSNGTGCNASGGGPADGWAAARPASGSVTITESVTVPEGQSKAIKFTLTCASNVTNMFGSASATIVDEGPTGTTPSSRASPSHGGGQLDFLSEVLLLGALALKAGQTWRPRI